MLNVNKGDTLVLNFGVMYPVYESNVTSISFCGKFASYNNLDDEEMIVNIESIKPLGTKSVNGSPIGVFIKENA